MLFLGKQGTKASSWMTANRRGPKDLIRYLNQEGISVAHITILGYKTVDGMKADAPHLVKTLARNLDSKPDVTACEGTGYFGSDERAPFSVDKTGYLTIRSIDGLSEATDE